MRDAGVRARLIAYPGEEHAFVSRWEASMRRTTDFLRTHLRG
jgi:acetyl esterase/lipase